MIRKKMALLITLVLVAGLLHQTGLMASEIDKAAYQEEADNNIEENEEKDDIGKKETDTQQHNNNNENASADEINNAQENMIDKDISEKGFQCYLNLYLYENQKNYLALYSEYLSKKKAVYEELYASGEITNDAVLDSAAQLAACMAQKNVLDNEEKYCRLYLEDYELNFDNIDIEKEKSIHDQEYYEAEHTGTSRVQIARYITDFQNAKALLNAKEIEITSLKEKVKMKKLLYEAGEITELEHIEEEVLLKKAEYEKAQYYINLNAAYYCLENGAR